MGLLDRLAIGPTKHTRGCVANLWTRRLAASIDRPAAAAAAMAAAATVSDDDEETGGMLLLLLLLSWLRVQSLRFQMAGVMGSAWNRCAN